MNYRPMADMNYSAVPNVKVTGGCGRGIFVAADAANELFQSNRFALKCELLNSKAVQYELSACGRYELFATANML